MKTLYIEVSKQVGLSKSEALEKGYYSKWDKKRIKGAFNFKNGTLKDFKRYMKDNQKYSYFIKVN